MPETGKRTTDVAARFTERYRSLAASGAIRAVEMEVLGASYGMSGYTTLAQADRLASALDLRTGMRVLDIGAGAGFPALYLAERTECDVVLADVPAEGIRRAHAHAAERGVASRCRCVLATANALPFRPRSFDAVVHTDVLC